MKKLFQIEEISEQHNHAGAKARADIAAIAEKKGFRRIPVSMDTFREGIQAKIRRQYGYLRDWNRAYHAISDGSVVLLQHPFHYPQLTRDRTLMRLKREKQVRFISFVHDVEELRAFRFNDYYRNEFERMLELADVLIVHNSRMRDWFLEKGVAGEKLVVLGIFDYLQRIEKADSRFEKSISVAGNLDPVKCGYVRELKNLKGIRVHLFGPNYREEPDSGNLIYHGSFPSDEIPVHLESGFGLVWDGESIDGCTGKSGQYLRYNNPHKLSLYISSGLPVVIWKHAAESEFVETNGIGLCVDSLYELETRMEALTEKEYQAFLEAMNDIRGKLQTGYYGGSALEQALIKLL